MRGVDAANFKGARLDRALCSIDWKMEFPDSSVEHLPMIESDHTPLLVNTSPIHTVNRNRKFMFNISWTTHQDFFNCLQRTWNPALDLESNKVVAAATLMEWNQSTFGNVGQHKRCLIAGIKGVQRNLALHHRSNLIKLDKKL